MRITSASCRLHRVSLKQPYVLSLTTLTVFESVVVVLGRSDGRVGIGEAVALPGYGWETTATVIRAVEDLVQKAAGQSADALVDRCKAVRKRAPFACSAVMAALDQPEWLTYLEHDQSFALNYAVSGQAGLQALEVATVRAISARYRHLKLKVGRDLDADLAAAASLLKSLSGTDIGVVIDANQAYTSDEAIAFLRGLERLDCTRLQWVEQLSSREDWGAAERQCRETRIPIVLDESIYDDDDIRRAASLGAYGVKLKLFKNFGLNETMRLAELARKQSLNVAFGNGVATDIGNFSEYLVLARAGRLFSEPSESSGFAKLSRPVTSLHLVVESGAVHCRETPMSAQQKIEMWQATSCASTDGKANQVTVSSGNKI